VRDYLLLAIIIGGSIYALRKPWIGVIMWTWVSLMNPHSFGWMAATLPIAMIVALCTLVGILVTHERQSPFLAPPVTALLFFTLWISITLPFSFHLGDSVPLWVRSLKIFLMIFVTLALLDTKRKLDIFVAVATLSIAFYGIKGGVFTLATGGAYRVWGPGGFIEGNNEIALALVMTIPLLRYLQQQVTRRWLRYAFGVGMLLTAVTVLGTYSRGALLALGAMAAFMWAKNDHKVVWGLMLVATALVILPFMPDAWWERMNTIQTYEEDSSAMGRINAWYMAFNLAKVNLFGGGFMVYTPFAFTLYAPDPSDIHAAHSIYFQVLGEHGFIGLFSFLLIWLLTWTTARRVQAAARKDPTLLWASQLVSMVQVGLVGYFVGGAFLSLAYFDFPYDMMAMVVIAWRLVQVQTEVKKAAPVAARKAAVAAAPAPALAPAPAQGAPAASGAPGAAVTSFASPRDR